MTTTAPVPIDPQQPLPVVELGDQSAPDNRSAKLFIDQGSGDDSVRPGMFNYLGMPIENPSMVFFAKQTWRRFFTFSYDDKPADLKSNPFGCASWDGKNAFGYGEKAPVAGQKPADRSCLECKHHAPPRGSKVEWCKPSYMLYGMLIHKDSDLWMPFFFDAGGLNAVPADEAFRLVSTRSQSNVKRQADGSMLAKYQIYSFAFTPKLIKNKGRTGYHAEWGQPSEVPPPDLAFIAQFFATHGVAMWTAEVDQRKAYAMTLGCSDATRASEASPKGPAPSEQAGEDYGTVPF